MLYRVSSLKEMRMMKSKQSKPREVREENGVKGRVIINIYLSILPLLPSLPLHYILACIGGNFLYGTYQYKLNSPPPICFFKGSKGRGAIKKLRDSVFPLPLDLKFKGRVREERREEL